MSLNKNSNQIIFDFINNTPIHYKPKKDNIRRFYKKTSTILESKIIQLSLFDLNRGSK
jgi:hypothetical protein